MTAVTLRASDNREAVLSAPICWAGCIIWKVYQVIQEPKVLGRKTYVCLGFIHTEDRVESAARSDPTES